MCETLRQWDTEHSRDLDIFPVKQATNCTNCRLCWVGYGFSWLKAFYWQNRSLNFSDLKPSYTKMKRMICSFGITNVLRNDWVYFPFNQILLVDTPSLPAALPGRQAGDQNNICHLRSEAGHYKGEDYEGYWSWKSIHYCSSLSISLSVTSVNFSPFTF